MSNPKEHESLKEDISELKNDMSEVKGDVKKLLEFRAVVLAVTGALSFVVSLLVGFFSK